MAKARNNSELNDAMQRGESTIEIEGDLAKKIIRLKATGNVAWAIAIAAIGMAVVVLIVGTPATVATGGLGAPLEIAGASAAFAPAVAVMGFDTVFALVALAVSAGGVGVLNRLRSDYKIVDQSENRLVLSKIS